MVCTVLWKTKSGSGDKHATKTNFLQSQIILWSILKSCPSIAKQSKPYIIIGEFAYPGVLEELNHLVSESKGEKWRYQNWQSQLWLFHFLLTQLNSPLLPCSQPDITVSFRFPSFLASSEYMPHRLLKAGPLFFTVSFHTQDLEP